MKLEGYVSRRKVLSQLVSLTVATAGGFVAPSSCRAKRGSQAPAGFSGRRIKDETFRFIEMCAREDGGYAISLDPNYQGSSDTAESDLAAVTYAGTLARTLGWELPHRERSADFIQGHQQPNGMFVNFQGTMNSKEDLAILYNTTQGAVGLRALGEKPKADPFPVLDRFFENDAFKKLPWYTISFYPLLCAAINRPFPAEYRSAIVDHVAQNQAADGYIGDHVAATFHMVHFFRLLGEPTPRAEAVVARTLHDQRPDGGWHLRPPNWDVHSCFDAVFILRQLSWDSQKSRAAISHASDWALSCQNKDGGFSHYPGEHSDMDAVYFQLGTLIQAQKIPGAKFNLPDAETLSWGHAMEPGRVYVPVPGI